MAEKPMAIANRVTKERRRFLKIFRQAILIHWFMLVSSVCDDAVFKPDQSFDLVQESLIMG